MARTTLSAVLQLCVVTTTMLIAFSIFSSPVSAGGCTHLPLGVVLCGKVYNKTPYNMKWTDNPDPDLNKRPGRCNVWNWQSVPWYDDKIVSCTQKDIPAGEHRGGDPVDVDAYCFADREYWAVNGWKKKGVWTRIHNGNTVTCETGLKEGKRGPICLDD